MVLPKKALREKDLKILSEELTGTNSISKVAFSENNMEYSGFFKRVSEEKKFTEFSAKLSVAVSILLRSFLGKKAAEERLVFDDKDNVVGIISIRFDEFKQLNYNSDPIPIDKNERLTVIPDVDRLLEGEAVETLFANLFLTNDDNHPHNNGTAKIDEESKAVLLDLDMFLAHLVLPIKPRPLIGFPQKRVEFTDKDWETFPVPSSKEWVPYHWPTHKYPGEKSLLSVETIIGPLQSIQDELYKKALPRAYADNNQFIELAKNSKAHQQKLAIALRALLTFDPLMLRKRLEDNFGSLALNYTCLDGQVRQFLETKYPKLFNQGSNPQSFVDFVLNLYQEYYDNLHRVVDFYMGCKDNGYGLSLPATYEALYLQPSLFKSILEWAVKQNKTTWSNESKEASYNLEHIKQRYLQVWSNSFVPIISNLLHRSYDLTKKIIMDSCPKGSKVPEIILKNSGDNDITSVLPLFGVIPIISKEQVQPSITLDPESKVRTAINNLIDFTNNFWDICKEYYSKAPLISLISSENCSPNQGKILSENDNIQFSKKLIELIDKYNLVIRQALAHTTTDANEFNQIIYSLEQLVIKKINFPIHLTTTDEQMNQNLNIVPQRNVPITDPKELTNITKSIFQLVDNWNSEEFSSLVESIITTKYENSLINPISNRRRGPVVREYLKNSTKLPNSHRLSYILCTGKEETGALNSLLIVELLDKLKLQFTIFSLKEAIQKNELTKYLPSITTFIVNYAKEETGFNTIIKDEGIKSVLEAMYFWVDNIKEDSFNAIIKSTVCEYESQLSTFSLSSRKSEVNSYCTLHKLIHSKIIALIFCNGEGKSTLNRCLFTKLIEAIQKNLYIDPSLENNHKGFKLIKMVLLTEHLDIYLNQLKQYSVKYTHQQDSNNRINKFTG